MYTYQLYVKNQRISKVFTPIGSSDSFFEVAEQARNLPRIYQAFIYQVELNKSYNLEGLFVCDGFHS